MGVNLVCHPNERTYIEGIWEQSIEDNTRGIQKFSDQVENEINNNKHSLTSKTKGHDGKTH
jgi:hypothetical protein